MVGLDANSYRPTSWQGYIFSQLMLSNRLWDCIPNKNLSQTSFGKIVLHENVGLAFHRSVLWRLKCIKFIFGWGSAPDIAGGAYSAPPNSLAGGEGGSLPLPKTLPHCWPSASIFGPSTSSCNLPNSLNFPHCFGDWTKHWLGPWSCCDLDLWPFDPKTKAFKFLPKRINGENVQQFSRYCVNNVRLSRTDRTNSPKTLF